MPSLPNTAGYTKHDRKTRVTTYSWQTRAADQYKEDTIRTYKWKAVFSTGSISLQDPDSLVAAGWELIGTSEPEIYDNNNGGDYTETYRNPGTWTDL